MTKLELINEKTTFLDLARMINKERKLVSVCLENVTIDGSEDDMLDWSKSVRGHEYMEEFRLTNVTVTDAAVDLDQVVSMLLVAVPELHTLKLENSPVTSSALACVGYCSSIKTLLLPNNALNDDDAAKIASAVAQNASIEKIDMTGNDLSDIGCVAFRQALKKNTSLQEVKLDGNGKISGGELNKIQGTLRERTRDHAQAA